MRSAPLLLRNVAISSRLRRVVLVFCSIWLKASLRPCARFSVSTESVSVVITPPLAGTSHSGVAGLVACTALTVSGNSKAINSARVIVMGCMNGFGSGTFMLTTWMVIRGRENY